MENKSNSIIRFSSLVIPVLFLTGCGFLNSGPSDDDFSLSYRAHYGLDCGMTFNCGYRLDLSQDRTLQFFDEPYDTVAIGQISLSQEEVDEIRDVLNQYEFFSSEYDWTNDEESLARGSAYISYQDADSSEGRNKTIPFEGEGIPEALMSLRLELDNALRSMMRIG